ncbi:MAG: LacI family DNA-binding transcriptional regulator [Lentisphaeria bacterium]|nr:LacI family DNA-binding transcriptional regulator [Lentisphaeria bacterium]
MVTEEQKIAGYFSDIHLQPDSPQPYYLQLAEQLRNRICRYHLPPGTRLPDIKSLAAMLKVSTKTTNSAYNELLRDNVCIRRAKKGTFVAGKNQSATGIPRRKVCLLYHGIQMSLLEKDAIRAALHNGILHRCHNAGIDLIYLTGDSLETIDFYLKNLQIEVIGIFVLDKDSYPEGINIARVFPGLRVLFFNDTSWDFEQTPRNLFGIFHDDFSGGYMVGNAMCALKPAKLGVIAISQTSDVYRRRANGFMLACRENGYDTAKDITGIWGQDNFSALPEERLTQLQHYGKELAGKLFSREPLCQGIFVPNDFLACGVWDYLSENSLTGKVILSGYDNIYPELSLSRKFSTVSIDFVRMGEKAVEILLSGSDLSMKAVYLPPQLIWRNTENVISNREVMS